MITCITILDKKPIMALVQDDRLVLLTELNPDNILQDLYTNVANYKVDTLKVLMRPNMEVNVSSTVLDDVLKVSDFNLRGVILSAIVSTKDLIALTNFGVVLGTNTVEVYDYVKVYDNLLNGSHCIGVDEWSGGGYLVIVKNGKSLEECNQFYDNNIKSKIARFSDDYGIDNIIYLGDYYEDNYEFECLRDTQLYYDDLNPKLKNKLIIIDYMLRTRGEILSQEDEVFSIELEDEDSEKEKINEDYIPDLDFTTEISTNDLQRELEEHRNRRKKGNASEKKSFFSRIFGKK